MEMDDRAGAGAFLVHDPVQETLFGRRVAGNEPAMIVELGEPRRIEPAEGSVGRRHQPIIREAQADVSGGTRSQAAIEDRGTDLADRLAGCCFIHAAAPMTEMTRLTAAPTPPIPPHRPLTHAP